MTAFVGTMLRGWSWQDVRIEVGDGIIVKINDPNYESLNGKYRIINILKDGTLVLDSRGKLVTLQLGFCLRAPTITRKMMAVGGMMALSLEILL